MVNGKIILTRSNIQIPRHKFEADLQQRLAFLSDEKKEKLFGQSLSFLNLAPLNSDIPFDFSKPEEMLDLKRVIYAQKANHLAVTNWIASLGLEAIFGVTTPLDKLAPEHGFEIIDIQNKYALVKHALDKKFFSKKIHHYYDLPAEIKARDKKFYHVINDAKTTLEGILTIQAHFRGGDKLDKNLLARLKNESVNLKLYRPSTIPHRVQDAYFVIVKEKESNSVAHKLSLALAKLDLISEQIPSFELGKASIKDYFGFAINTQEHIQPEQCRTYELSTVNRLKKFFSNSEFIHYRYVSGDDNFYRGEKREMRGIQMYLSPSEIALAEGRLILPFPQIAGASEHYKNIFPVSCHLQGAKAYAEAQIGGYGIKPHLQYKDEEQAKMKAFMKGLPADLKRSYIRNISLLEDVNDLEPIYVAFELDNII